jgi:phospholipid-transporting ATPase
VTPKQKAMMVSLIKERQPLTTTLAIGDGANDVNMITAAHIGIGILGVEGRQAARASDYAIAQFSFLKRLLFVHGRESYRKNSYVVCYNFYKNVLFVMPQFWYGMISYFSGQTLYDPWIYQLYNIVFTCLPIIWFGIYDKEVSYDSLMIDTRYYVQGMIGKLFHSIRFWKWVGYGMIQAVCVYVFSFVTNSSATNSEGRHQDIFSNGKLFSIF